MLVDPMTTTRDVARLQGRVDPRQDSYSIPHEPVAVALAVAAVALLFATVFLATNQLPVLALVAAASAAVSAAVTVFMIRR